ncbi:MAG: helix-turn-helix transcriptional regulator [Ruminococcaceae bacterium]|nr:helix-turn-helix transcriptional regulator [Oscillospiraceae bacterium]
MNPEKIGNFISEQRKAIGLTQQELAEKIGVTRKAISRWETGRGYPDIELLPKISETFSITINELLNGEKLPEETIPIAAEENLTFVCNDAGKTKKRNKTTIIILAVLVSVTLVATVILAWFALREIFSDIKSDFAGYHDCVISYDYSCITYYGEKYVPLDTKGYDCTVGERLVGEAKVEGVLILGKLLFGDSIYAVRDCPDNSIIYLETDYDFPPSEYYVKESDLARMEEIIENFERTYTYALVKQYIEDPDIWTYKEILLNDDYGDLIKNLKTLPQDTTLDCGFSHSKNEESVPVITYEKNHIFYKSDGELLYKNKKYFYYDYNNAENPTQYALQTHPYPLEEKYYDQLKSIFSLMWQ